MKKDNYGFLVEYLSEIGCGSWRQFRQALATSEATPGTPAVWVMRDLAALGHIEFEPETMDWAMCPPSIAELPGFGGQAVGLLCGARSPKFLARVNALLKELGGSYELIEERVVIGMRLMLPSKASLRTLADRAELPLLEDAAGRLATCLPSVAGLLRAAKAEPVAMGPGLEQLVGAPGGQRRSYYLQWGAAKTVDAPGVYRQDWGFRQVYWWKGLLNGAPDSRRTSSAIALYARCPDLMTYEQRSSSVQFPAGARPPDLHLRALVLCSGTLPKKIGLGQIEATGVPAVIARTVMERLRQRVS